MLGWVQGRTKKEAMENLLRRNPKFKGKKIHLEYVMNNPPFKIYEASIDTTVTKRGK